MFLLLPVLPVLYLLYINYSCQIYAQNKQCTNCKHFVPHKNNKISELGLCKMFGNRVYSKENIKVIYNFAQHCRDDESLCGKNAIFYEDIESKIEKNENRTEQNENSTNPKANDTNDTKDGVIKIMDDEMKKLMKDYYYFLRNGNW
jgi:hypothetical protein